MAASLQRLVIGFEGDGVQVRALYRRRSQAGPNPGTKARAREVRDLVRAGLGEALNTLDAPDGRVDVIGTAGFETREDTLHLERETKGG